MPAKNFYVSEEDLPYWEQVLDIAKRRRVSVSKLLASQLRVIVRESEIRKTNGLPLDFTIPASMKDPAQLRREEAADAVRALFLQHLEEAETS